MRVRFPPSAEAGRGSLHWLKPPSDSLQEEGSMKKGSYIFCETIACVVWHLRVLTSIGPKYGGGADSLALCGAKALWDLNVPVTLKVPGLCRRCKQLFLDSS